MHNMQPQDARRERRAARYAVKLAQAMRQEGAWWKAQAFRPPYTPLRRALAKHKMGYAGN